MSNPVCYFEIGTRDAAAGREFYTKLFGWKTKEFEPTYHEVVKEDAGIGGGIFQVKEGEFPPYVTIYVEVDDLQKYLDRAIELGGKQIVEPTPIPGIGSFAMFADPDGNCIGIYKS